MLGNKLLLNLKLLIQLVLFMMTGVFSVSNILSKLFPWSFLKITKYVLKLTGLPSGTTFIDLIDIINAVEAKSCVIPKGLKAYQPRPFAYIAFSSESKMLKALKTSYSLVNSDLTWVTTKQKLCEICGSPSHLAKVCPKNKTKSNKKYQTIYECYKPANYQKYLPKKTQ